MANNYASLDTLFHALSDPTRRAVVQRLSEGPASVSDLAQPFEMALPSFLKHLGVLETSGVITSRKVGRVRTCALQPAGIAVAETWLSRQRAIWEGRTDRLAAHVQTLTTEESPDDRSDP